MAPEDELYCVGVMCIMNVYGGGEADEGRGVWSFIYSQVGGKL